MDIIETAERNSISLNEQQLEAIRSTDRPTLLLAVPGSGKTTVLVIRLGHLIFDLGIKPESILAITYTVSAAKELSARFAELFGQETADRIEFRTLNGLSAKVIAIYGRASKKTSFELMTDEKDKQAILAELYVKYTHQFPTESDLSNLSSQITYVKNMQLSAAEIETLGNDLNLPLKEIFDAYNHALREKQLMDYDDQMVYAHRILKRSEAIADYFRRKYPFICVDEAQDTSKIQHEIISLIAGDGRNLFMVGDEDQSIYSFRAACPEAMLSFGKRYPGARVLMLEENHRSTKTITEAADRFIRMNRFRYSKAMKTMREYGEPIDIISMKKRTEQYRFLLDVAGNCQSETAVLYRDNESVLPFVDLLERNGVPYRMRGMDAAFFSNRIVADIGNLIRFAFEPDNTELFMQIYYKINLYINKNTALKLCMDCDDNDLSVLETAARSEVLPPRLCRNAEEMAAHFKTIRESSASDALFLLTKIMGYESFLERSHLGTGKLEILSSLAVNEPTSAGFLERLQQLRDLVCEPVFHENAKLTLSTIHSAKGLEFDTVYLMDVADGIFPERVTEDQQKADRKTLERYEEERRVFYVGVTRAKNHLHIFDMPGGSTFVKELTGEKVSELQEIFIPARAKIKRQPARAQLKPHAAPAGKKISGEDYEKLRAKIEAEGRLIHKRFGEGTIIRADGDLVDVSFPDKERKLNLRVLIENGLIG